MSQVPETKLKHGLIPANTVCPFKETCQLIEGCFHNGLTHSTAFSCAIARWYDVVGINKVLRERSYHNATEESS